MSLLQVQASRLGGSVWQARAKRCQMAGRLWRSLLPTLRCWYTELREKAGYLQVRVPCGRHGRCNVFARCAVRPVPT